MPISIEISSVKPWYEILRCHCGCNCRNYIDDSFRVYTGALVGNDEEEESSEEEEEGQDSDMELEEAMGASVGSLRTKSRHKSDDSLIQQFMYGASPGFKV